MRNFKLQKGAILSALFLTSQGLFAAQTGREIINSILQDWLLPFFFISTAFSSYRRFYKES